ncbi:hypothetical protein ACLOJK_017685 [Asimina triloba]
MAADPPRSELHQQRAAMSPSSPAPSTATTTGRGAHQGTGAAMAAPKKPIPFSFIDSGAAARGGDRRPDLGSGVLPRTTASSTVAAGRCEGGDGHGGRDPVRQASGRRAQRPAASSAAAPIFPTGRQQTADPSPQSMARFIQTARSAIAHLNRPHLAIHSPTTCIHRCPTPTAKIGNLNPIKTQRDQAIEINNPGSFLPSEERRVRAGSRWPSGLTGQVGSG